VGSRAGLDGRKISSPRGFDPRTIQPVASRYTDCATGPTTSQKAPQLFSKFTGKVTGALFPLLSACRTVSWYRA